MGYHLIKAEKQIAFYADFILNVVTRMGKTKQSQVCTNKKKTPFRLRWCNFQVSQLLYLINQILNNNRKCLTQYMVSVHPSHVIHVKTVNML